MNLAKVTIPAVLATITLAAAPALAGTCPTDLDGDGTTGFTDLTNLLGAWGPCPACPQDLDGSGDVGFTDLTQLLGSWGPCPVDQFEYPVYENALAVEVGQQYLNAADEIALPQEIYDRVDRDIALMVAERPEIDGSPHQGPWTPYYLFIGVDQTVALDELDALIAYYQGELVDSYFDDTMRLYDFPQGANPDALIPIFEAIPAVEYAEPDFLFGGSEYTMRWKPTEVGGGALLWTVVVGWDPGGFCDRNSSGCQCFTTYEFITEADGTLTPLGLSSEPSPFDGGGDCTGYPPSP